MTQIANQTDFVTVAGKKIAGDARRQRSAAGVSAQRRRRDGLDGVSQRPGAAFLCHRAGASGFSLSEGLDQIDNIHDLAWHYVDFFEQFNLNNVPVVGFSLGGWLAVELAILRPELVGKLVMVNRRRIARAGRADGRVVYRRSWINCASCCSYDPAGTIATGNRAAATRRNSTADVLARPRGHGPRRLESVSARSEVAAAFAAREMPDAVDLGPRRQTDSAGARRILRAAHSRARLEVLDQCGHMLPYEKTDEFVRLVTKFAK